jgi:hypothetical protein
MAALLTDDDFISMPPMTGRSRVHLRTEIAGERQFL